MIAYIPNKYNVQNNTSRLIVIFALLVYVTQGFDYVNWGTLVGGLGLNFIVYGLILFACIAKKSTCMENFRGLVLLLTICPFFTMPVTLGLYGQSMFDSFTALFPTLVWLFYFILHKYHFKESTIYTALLMYSGVLVLIQIIQQFTYPTAYFGLWSDNYIANMGYGKLSETVPIRNGIYRFLNHCNGYTAVPVLLFYLGLIKQRFTTRRFIIVLSMIVSVYLSLTRQVIASCAFIVLLSIIINRNKRINLKYVVIVFILAIFSFIYSDTLFGEMAEDTQNNMNSEYIRLLEYSFYWDKVCENVWTFIFGHGIAKSGYFLDLTEYWLFALKMHAGDVGFVGIWFHYGMLYILLYLYFLYIVYKFRRQIPVYVLLFVVFTGLMSIMIFPFWTYARPNLVWTMMLYICDLHINKSPLRYKGL